MATSALTSSLFSSLASSSATANSFANDLNKVAADLQQGNLSAAKEDYVTLSKDALNGATASTATTSASGITTTLLSRIAASPSAESSFVSELNQLGTDLGNGNLNSAQGDMLTIDSQALNNSSAASANSPSTSSTTSQPANTKAIIQSIVQAIDAGNSSLAGTFMSQLASDSSSSQGASILSQASAAYTSASSSAASSSSGSSSINQLLASVDQNNSSSSSSLFSAIA